MVKFLIGLFIIFILAYAFTFTSSINNEIKPPYIDGKLIETGDVLYTKLGNSNKVQVLEVSHNSLRCRVVIKRKKFPVNSVFTEITKIEFDSIWFKPYELKWERQ